MNPTKLGRFEIIREIGKGAMGQVFLANDPKIERKVAIKTIVLPPGTSAAEAQETSQRFVREAQAAGKLLHPNIVTIFDVGEDGGVSFIAMEYIEGHTLEKCAKPDSLLPLARVLDLIVQAASALDYAHENHVIHRDIKSANLMMQSDGTLKITDFGLAKNPAASLTQAGVLLGTPSYMSPEQIQGKELDGRSDLFSLGVVLYELLTGVRPFEADSISTIIYRVLYEDPRPPAAHNPALPSEVNLVLDRALAKSPDKRYARGADLVTDLRKVFSNLPPDTLSRPFPVTVRRPAGAEPDAARLVAAPTVPRGRKGRATRAEARAIAARRGDAGPDMAEAAAPGPTLIAHHPGKIAALVITLVGAVVVFPRLLNHSEPARGAAETLAAGAAADAGGAVSPAAIGGVPAAASAPPGAAGAPERGQVALDVETIPHGGAITLDALPLAEPRIVLSLADAHAHQIVAQAGCRRAAAEMSAADLASFKGPLVLEMTSRKEEVRIVSNPPGASIVVDGRDTGKTTPAGVVLDACADRAVALQQEGYRPWTRQYDATSDFEAMAAELGAVALDPIPKGTLLVKTLKGYEVDVYAGSERLGKSGQPITLLEGTHALTFRNDGLLVKESASVAVAGGRAVTPLVDFPSLGTLTVQAQPSNCKVFVDGAYFDVTPVLNRSIASGSHRVKVVFVPNGAARDVPVKVEPGKNARVVVKF